jgi:hypothetical protein
VALEDRHAGADVVHEARGLQALAVGQVEVEQDSVDVVLLRIDLQRILQRGCLEPMQLHALQFGVAGLHAIAHQFMVVDQQDLPMTAWRRRKARVADLGVGGRRCVHVTHP